MKKPFNRHLQRADRQVGKGDHDRTVDKVAFRAGYDAITWTPPEFESNGIRKSKHTKKVYPL